MHAPPALLCTSRPLSAAEAKARRKLVLRATIKNDDDTSFESQWAAAPEQPLMPLLADLELSGLGGHRPHSTALLGIAPEGPLCNWAEAEESFTACIARRVYKAEIDAKPDAQAALRHCPG